MDWMVTLASGEKFVVVNQPDEEEALCAADQVRADYFYQNLESQIVSIEPKE